MTYKTVQIMVFGEIHDFETKHFNFPSVVVERFVKDRIDNKILKEWPKQVAFRFDKKDRWVIFDVAIKKVLSVVARYNQAMLKGLDR